MAARVGEEVDTLPPLRRETAGEGTACPKRARGSGLLAETGPEPKRGILSNLTKFFVHYPLGAGAMCVLVAIVAAAFFAPWFVPFDPLEG